MGANEVNEITLSSATCWVLGAGASYDCIGDGGYCVPLTYRLIRKSNITDAFRLTLMPFIERALVSARTFDDAIGRLIELTVDELRALTDHPDVAMQQQAATALLEFIRVIAAMVSVGSIPAMYDDEEGFRAENYGWLAFH